jgi:hypothetical protein
VTDSDLSGEAWRQAGRILGLHVVAPFDLETPDGPIRCTAYIRDFGRRAGTVVLGLESPERDRFIEATRVSGYFSSLLGPAYAVFDRDEFVATLNDWGWFGDPEVAPDWYTGEPWTT